MASRSSSTLFESGCCAASERLHAIMHAAVSKMVERQGGRAKVEIAIFMADSGAQKSKYEKNILAIS